MNFVEKCTIEFDRKELLDSIKGFKHKGIFYPLKEYQHFNLQLNLPSKINDDLNLLLATDQINKYIMATILGENKKLKPKRLAIDPRLIALVNSDERIQAISTTFLSKDKIPILYFKTNDLSHFEKEIKKYLEEHNFLKKIV
jgi:hypothetical protein